MTHISGKENQIQREVAYYQRLSADLTRYRDYRWKIPIWTMTFMSALSAAVTSIHLPPRMKWLVTAVAALVGIFSSWHLHNCYERYIEHKRRQDKIEKSWRCDGVQEQQPEQDTAGSSWKVWLCRLGRLLWPKWPCQVRSRVDKDWQHKVFRLGWLLLMLAATVFAICATHMDRPPGRTKVAASNGARETRDRAPDQSQRRRNRPAGL